MVNLIFLVGLDIDPVACDEFGDWIEEELFMVLSHREFKCYEGELE